MTGFSVCGKDKMNLQEFKDRLHKAGWNGPNDVQGENIKNFGLRIFQRTM